MLSKLLKNTNIFPILKQIDFEFSEKVRKKGCPYCGSVLNYANYNRKPRGGPDNLPEEYTIRYSLCCSNPECRKRTLPPSCLFWERKVYLRHVIVVVMTLYQRRLKSVLVAKLSRMFDISRQTIKRWINYFRYDFPESYSWKRMRGRIASTVDNRSLPGALVDYFLQYIDRPEDALVACLRFLATGLFDP